MMPGVGDVIGGKYRIVRLIGDGGMGTVYEAHHEFLETTVALKFLHTELAKRAGLGSRFLQEARVSARIRSPHVTHVTDVDQTSDGSPYLVMELLHGEPLQQLMDRRGKLPVEQAVDFALQILSGLESAHAIGVVHRDLKPDNVFIVPATGGPLLKLIDFGIAKLRASTEFQKGLTRAGVIMGTPEYMAPEQLFAAENVDHRADLYSLGVILFEMIAGRRPADGDDVEAIVASVVSGNVRRLANLEPGLSPGLIAIVERALAPDREQRWGSAHEMRLALAPFAGALSYAGRIAASPEPVHPSPSNAPPAFVHAPGTPAAAATPAQYGGQTGPLQAFEPVGSMPKTLPPSMDPGTINFKGSTQEVSDQAVLEAMRQSALPGNLPPANFGYQQHAGSAPGAPAPHRRRSRAGLWVGLSLLILLGLGGAAVAAVFYEQHQQDTSVPPLVLDTPTPETTVSPLIDAGSATHFPTTSPTTIAVTPGRTTATPIGTPTSTPRPADAGAPATAADAGRNTFPFPFPLPSTLPPLPSNFPPLPKTFPTAFPSVLPPGFPVFPGFPLGAQAKPDGGK